MQFRQALLAATVLALPLLAPPGTRAQTSGVYIGIAAGGNFASGSTNRRSPAGYYNPTNNPNQAAGNQNANIIGRGFEARFNAGPVVVASMGYGFGNGLRAEIEGNYRQNGFSTARFFGNGNFQNGFAGSGGESRIYGFMANAYYDFDLSVLGPGLRWIQPYIGAGLGLAAVQYDKLRVALGNASLETALNGTATTLGYQVMLGAAFPLDGLAPGLSLTAEYRYYGAVSPTFSGAIRTVPQAQQGQPAQPFTLSTYRVSPDVGNHSVLLGLRYAFDQPAAAGGTAGNLPVGWTVPMPAVQARTYLVFFANNSAALDAAARQTIAEAVQSARSQQTSSIELVGRADATGNAARNRQLAEMRNRNVAAELGRLGIPAGAIRASALGAAGEAAGPNSQARRVDIILQ